MNADSQGRTPDELYSDFLRREDRAELFEEWVARHPGRTEALYRVHLAYIGLDVAPLSESTSSVFYSARSGSRPAGRFELSEGGAVGGFELVAPLGQGGMGEVWKAFQVSLERNVALKFIRSDRSGDRLVRRFKIEARAGGRLNHPNLVSVYDTGHDDGRYWIAQELVEGGCTLRDVIDEYAAQANPPPHFDRHVARFFYRMARALDVAHQAGVIHRDIKPNNILVTPDDSPKIGDFGLALLLDEGTISQIGLEGTPYYMSPEQAAAKSIGIDARTDIFSLGAVLYEMLTFRRPFDGDTNAQVLERILHVDPVDPHRLARRVPGELASIVMGCLEKHRADRYQTMAAVAEDLRRYLADEPILRKPPGPLQRARKWTRRHPTGSVAIGAGLILGAALGWLGPELLSERGRSQAAEKETHLVEARWAIDRGDLDLARERVERALALDPRDPRGHVYLASGYFQYARLREAEEQIRQAIAQGFSTDPPVDGTAEDHLAYALYVWIAHKSAGWDEAAAHLERALELAPDLEGALYHLYQVRKIRGDVDGARESLRAFQRRLELGDDFLPITEALLHELEGDFEGAIDEIEAADIPPERRLALRCDRILGRNQLQAGQYAAAIASLEAHLGRMPDDPEAKEFLAKAHLRLADGGSDVVSHADAAIAAIQASIDWDPARALPYSVLTEALLVKLGARDDPYAPLPVELVERTSGSLDAWRERDAADAKLAEAEAQLRFLEALPALGAGDTEAGIERLERCLEFDPLHTIARVVLAQKLRGSDPEASLAHFERAVENWERDRERKPGRPTRWLFSAEIEIFGNAAKHGDAVRARRAREEAEEVLANGVSDAEAELLTYAEYLATSPDDLRDCGRAEQLLDDYGLRAFYAGRADAEELLELIASSCR